MDVSNIVEPCYVDVFRNRVEEKYENYASLSFC